ncbi:MAG: T9SS type A sorting domain-containing protein, partial [Flavobacteriales bacterium]|nr:T9SS type A sorting domain-containing protein [Flavobacteriales bacterium]
GSNGANAVITLATTVGVNYLIRIQRYNTSDAMFGTICITRPPTNDNCATAIDLPVIDNCYVQYFSNTGATASGTSPNPSCGGTPSTDVWFRFVTPASGVVHISTTAGTLADGSMQIYSGTCGALALVANGCNNDGGVAPDNLMPRLDRRCTPLSGNTTYYIRFWGYNGAQGSFGICVYGPDIFPTPMQDCSGGFTVCGSGVITNTSDWTGCTADLKNTNRGCLLNNERQGTWYYFSPRSTGSVGFTIQPTDHLGQPAQIDYDFAVWGPMNAVTCPPSGAPLRCSYAYPPSAGTWLTGMAAGNSDLSEGASGGSVNGFVAPITVAVGDVGKVYTIYIDNFDVSGQTFNLSWALSAPNQLDCSVLPVEVIDLKAVAGPGSIAVEWTAQDIAATDLFLVERSADGMAFDVIGSLRANGTGSGTTRYLFHDEVPIQGVNYYRITSISADGQQAHTSVVNALFRPVAHTLLAMPNPAHTTLRILVDDKDLNGPATLLLMDGSGRLIATQRSEADAGTTDISISVADLDAGYYLFQLVDAWGGLVGTGRFVKE